MLEEITKENDIRTIPEDKLDELSREIRDFLIEKVSRTGGHLASNLGVVELTMAMHRTFHLPEDKIIWDVGHQSYTHKILTGRKNDFDKLRKYGGMSGFPKRKESDCDAFDTGHSSTSISAGLGYVAARDLRGEHYSVVSVIGDGALTGGMAYEALNNASRLRTNFIIVLNDNHMSISENVGGMSSYLARLRTADIYTGLKREVSVFLSKVPVVGEIAIEKIRRTKSSIKYLFVPGMFFEDMGITYLGPVPGHDIGLLCKALREAARLKGPVLLHVVTTKGKGYAPAENAPDKFHGVGPFDAKSGVTEEQKKTDTYSDVFGRCLCREAKKNPQVVAITAAMKEGTGLAGFARRFPRRFFDVGIAEAHGTTFAAGMAAGGMKPVFAVYSSFLQRAYDQMIHDVALQKLPVVFAIDRAGIVGSDGETHQGIFDLSYLNSIPNMVVMSPKNKWELMDMLKFSIAYNEGPIAIRYPRGEACPILKEHRTPIVLGRSEIIFEGKDIVLMSVGSMMTTALEVYEKLKLEGISVTLVNARFVKPMDQAMINDIADHHKMLAVMEENVMTGGFGEQVMAYVEENRLPIQVIPVALPDDYVEHGNADTLRRELGLDSYTVFHRVLTKYREILQGEP